MNKWEEMLGIKFPECKQTGQCCKMASPSVPASLLLEKAAEGDDYARDFFSIFMPYNSLKEALAVNEKTVKRSLKAAEEQGINPNEIVFYHCRFIGENNSCLIHEDRPQLCRDYPDTPFLVFSESCIYNGWSKECREKYKELKEEAKALNEQRKIIRDMQLQQQLLNKYKVLKSFKTNEAKSVYLLGNLSIVSPKAYWLKKY
ncbi:MAG: YkgJ family cysteine cluster protein [bacterium]